TSNAPARVYSCAGFCTVELVPSPKSHVHPATDPVVRSVNATASGATPVAGATAKSGTGGGGGPTWISAGADFVFAPAVPLTVNATVKSPPERYVCDGFVSVLVAPSPKLHRRFWYVPVERSRNATESGAMPVLGVAAKLAVGRWNVPLF